MLNETEYLLTTLGEEGSEVAQQTCKALRFGLTDCEPGQNEDNRRRIEKEVADLLATFELLGFRIREEDKTAKREKLMKYMEYSRKVGTLQPRTEVRGICSGCNEAVPLGFYTCDGGGSHPAIEIQKR